MRVQLDAGIFAPAHGARFHRELLAIFGWGYEGRHAVHVEPRGARDLERWLAARDEDTREMCQFALEVGVDAEREESAPYYTLHVADAHDDAGRWRDGDTLLLSPPSAVEVLGRPLKILVENRQNDGAFLRVVARRQYAAKLTKVLAKRWAEVDSAGGITTNHVWLDEETRDPKTRARLWVLFDSDALAEGKPHDHAKNMRRLCNKRGVRHHMLARRAIENYLPIPLLHVWRCQGNVEAQRKNKARVDALATLTDQQRYYYNMWEGFDGDAARADANNVGHLYDGLLPHVRDALRRGIAYDIADLFHERDIKIREQWLTEDKHDGETTAFLNTIFALV